MSRVAVPARELRTPVVKAALAAAAAAGNGEATLEGYDERSGMFEFRVERRDKSSQVVAVHLVMECHLGIPTAAEPIAAAA